MAWLLISSLRWTARVLGTLLLLLIVALAIGEGVHVDQMFQGRLALATLSLLAMLAGQIVAWRWEGWGGLLIVGSFLLFVALDPHLRPNLVFAVWPLTGLLYLACWRLQARSDNRATSMPLR